MIKQHVLPACYKGYLQVYRHWPLISFTLKLLLGFLLCVGIQLALYWFLKYN